MKKIPGDIIVLHKCTKNHDYMLYCSRDKACDRCNCCFSFWAIFCPFTPPPHPPTPNSPKDEKNTWRYRHFTHVYQKLWLDNVQFLRYGVRQTNRRRDTQRDRKIDIEVGAPPKNFISCFWRGNIQFKSWQK